jgi:hypothetical protein
MTDFNAIAKDLDACDLMMAIGNAKSRKMAKAHRKACMTAIHAANVADGLAGMSDEELLAELAA